MKISSNQPHRAGIQGQSIGTCSDGAAATTHPDTKPRRPPGGEQVAACLQDYGRFTRRRRLRQSGGLGRASAADVPTYFLIVNSRDV